MSSEYFLWKTLFTVCPVFHNAVWTSNPFVGANLFSRLEKYNQDGQLCFPYFGMSGLKCVCEGSAAENSPQEPQLRSTRCYFFSRLENSGQKNGLVVPCTLQFYVPVLRCHWGLSNFWEEYHSLDLSNILLHKSLVDANSRPQWYYQWPLCLLPKLQDCRVKQPWVVSEDACDKRILYWIVRSLKIDSQESTHFIDMMAFSLSPWRL